MQSKRINPSRKFQGMTITAEMVGDMVADYLSREFGPLKCGDKIAGRRFGVNQRTIINWRTRQCAPRSAELIRLMASCDELRDEVLRLVEKAKERG